MCIKLYTMANLLESLRGFITPDLISTTCSELGKSEPATAKAFGGYTDNVGQPASNRKLSQSRAEAVKAAIQEQGIDDNRLKVEGYGEQHPIADNTTEEGRAQNRPIDVLVTQK